MEQAVNQFNKGLLMDTHPMVLGNDTLSDALNATFITMNGNEVVLQNDMGNRRIDNAFLPSGYLPLGMKEYGGVIYVAAYNPLTNRGLVGSFPSPLRKININNINGPTLNFHDFIEVIRDENSNIIYGNINKEYIIIPISDKLVLHTGDKFSIYSNLIVDILPYLTLPSDTKNNLFTFLVGVFNSLNEFVDITDNLKLWDIPLLTDTKYFINEDSGVQNETIADDELIKARNRLAINTYSLKMASPLYLKAIINHINNISYSIGGEIVGENKVNLEVEVTFYYNCIDYISGKHFKINFNGTDYTISGEPNEITYIEETNQYTVTYIYKINNITVSNEEISGLIKYKYEIKFPLLHNFSEWDYPIYIDSLNKTGELDLSKLDSDTLIFKGYRYYNNTSNDLTTLVIDLESYPKKEEISKLHFCTRILDPVSNTNIAIEGKNEIIDKFRPGTGTFTILFPYKELEKRKLYLFEFYYYNDSSKTPKEDILKGFYITTPIFNENYIGEKGNSSELYSGDINYSYDEMSNLYIDNFMRIKKILLSPILNSSVFSVPINNTKKVSGNYIEPLSITYSSTSYTLLESTEIKNTIKVSASINNIELYPYEVESLLKIRNIDNPIKVIERNINENVLEKQGNNYIYSKDLKEIKSPDLDENENVIKISERSSFLNVELNLLKIELFSNITVNNFIKGVLELKSIYCDHLITSFSNLIKKYYYGANLTDYITLRPPYITIDWEGKNYVSIIVSSSLDDLTAATYDAAREEHSAEKINGKSYGKTFYIDEVARDGISDFILSHCDGQLIVGEYSGDDHIGGFTPCIGNGIGTFYPGLEKKYMELKNFKRLWLKINKKEYIPIFVYGPDRSASDSESAINDFYNDNGAFNLIFSKIPHYYEYETGGKTLQEKIINPVTMNKTIEFQVDSNVGLVILENISLARETDYYLLQLNFASAEVSFNEGTISSNEDFIEEVENLSNYHVSSAIMSEYENDHLLSTRDYEGNAIDPLYVYYDNSELNPLILENVFKKSYVAEKFYVPDLNIYMPELKSSRKLYGGEFGEHGLINEYAYPVIKTRKTLFNGYGAENVPNDLSSPSVSYSKGLWDKTFILWEGGSGAAGKLCQLPLRTKNIFNRTIIITFELTTPLEDGSTSMSNWIDYDDYIRDLNNS